MAHAIPGQFYVVPGQVYRSTRDRNQRMIVDRFVEYGRQGEEMWSFVGQSGNANIECLVRLGYIELYSNNSLNG